MTKAKKNGGGATSPQSEKKGNKQTAAQKAAEHLRGAGAKPGDDDVKKTQGVLRSIGDNGPKDADFKHHMLTILGFKSKLETANSYLQDAYKKATNAGLDTKAIKQAIGFKKKTSDEIVAFLKQLQKSMKAAEINLPVQEEMFGRELNRPAIIFQEGFDLGTAGKPCESETYDANTAEGQILLQGWHAGQRSLTTFGAKTPKNVDSKGEVAGNA